MIGFHRKCASLPALLLLVGLPALTLFTPRLVGAQAEVCADHVCACTLSGRTGPCCCSGESAEEPPAGPAFEVPCSSDQPVVPGAQRAALQPVVVGAASPVSLRRALVLLPEAPRLLAGFLRPIDKVPITPTARF